MAAGYRTHGASRRLYGGAHGCHRRPLLGAYIIVGAMLVMLYVGLYGFLQRVTARPLEYLAGRAMLVISIPFVGVAAFRYLPDLLAELIR
jgi:hypothetical protein